MHLPISEQLGDMELALAQKHKQNKVDGDEAPLIANNDGVLPTDVLLDILLRIPTKPLCRLRLVCRSWRSLTSDPIFLKANTSRHPLFAGIHKDMTELHIFGLRGGDIVIRRIHLPRPCLDLTSQQDMVCVSAGSGPTIVIQKGTGQASALAEFKDSPTAFPSTLVYVPSTGDYKVLRFKLFAGGTAGGHRQFVQACYVLTLGGGGGGGDGGRWRAAPQPAVPVDDAAPTNRAVIAGVAYFLMHHFYIDKSGNLGPDSIASFDLAAEEWKPTPIRGPVSCLLGAGGDKLSYEQHRSDFQLTKLGGSLVVVHCKYQECSMDIWFLVDGDRGVWSRRCSMQCAPEWEHRRLLCPVAVLDDGMIVTWMGVERVMRMYDPRTKTWAPSAITRGMYFSVQAYYA